MDGYVRLTVILTFLLCAKAEQIARGTKFWDITEAPKRLSISVVSKRNENDKWLTTFNAFHDSENISMTNNITVDVSHSAAECEGKTRIRITGVLAEDPLRSPEADVKMSSEELRFDQKCGTNVAVVKNGLTVQKINLEDPINSVVFTNRPLEDDELFEVRLDKKNNKFSLSLGIGATTNSPKDIAVLEHINFLPLYSWAMYHEHLFRNGALAVKNYGINLNELAVGDRVGVMRSANGNIHYYVNGVDQGPASSNVPQHVLRSAGTLGKRCHGYHNTIVKVELPTKG